MLNAMAAPAHPLNFKRLAIVCMVRLRFASPASRARFGPCELPGLDCVIDLVMRALDLGMEFEISSLCFGLLLAITLIVCAHFLGVRRAIVA